jgi:hypothetical protein
MGWTTEISEFESLQRQDFSVIFVVQTGSGVHLASFPMGTGGFLPGVKSPGRKADHSPSTSAEIKNTWTYTSIPLYSFME